MVHNISESNEMFFNDLTLYFWNEKVKNLMECTIKNEKI